MHKLYLSNEDKLQKEIDNLDLEGIFRDSIVQQHVTDPMKMEIVSRNKRQEPWNIPWLHGHSLWKDKVTDIVESQIVFNTWRYMLAEPGGTAKKLFTIRDIL